jgi:hypothetical protein
MWAWAAGMLIERTIIQPRPAEPAAQKSGKLVYRYIQVIRVHIPDHARMGSLVHDAIEILDQFLNSLYPARGFK